MNLNLSLPMATSSAAYKAAEKAVGQLREAGVPILAGTDVPNPGTTFGASLHGELELLVRAGLRPLEALRAATSVPAAVFGLAGRGRIRPGAIADLVLVNGDPSTELTATRDIVAVWKAGNRVDREAYRLAVRKAREDVEKLKKSPPPEYGNLDLISDFEGETPSSVFGSGWIASTDSIMGGKSKVELKIVEGGAADSRSCLLIRGTVAEAGTIRWAGALFSPGKGIFAPANLSAKKGFSFWARGEGKSMAVMLYSQTTGFIPRVKEFKPGPEWKEYVFSWADFNLEGYDITGMFWGAVNEPGDFTLYLDNVRLQN